MSKFLTLEEREEFDKLLDWLTYDSNDKLEDIDKLVHKIQEKIYLRNEEPTKDDLQKLRQAREKIMRC